MIMRAQDYSSSWLMVIPLRLGAASGGGLGVGMSELARVGGSAGKVVDSSAAFVLPAFARGALRGGVDHEAPPPPASATTEAEAVAVSAAIVAACHVGPLVHVPS